MSCDGVSSKVSRQALSCTEVNISCPRAQAIFMKKPPLLQGFC